MKPRHAILFLFLLAVALVLPAPAVRADAMSAAKQIQGALASGDLRGFNPAMSAWRNNEDEILENKDASLITALAFAGFVARPQGKWLGELSTQMAEIAQQCADAADDLLTEDDHAGRSTLGQALVKLAAGWLNAGHGDKASEAQDRALIHLEAVAAAEAPPVPALLELGSLYGQLASREPPKAEEWIAKAGAVFEKAKEAAGESPILALKTGQMKVQLAELREERLLREPKDRKLKRSIKDTWEEAFEIFEKALEKSNADKDLKSAYNECLWNLQRVKDGKAKKDPIMEEHSSRYHKVTMEIPVSNMWTVKPDSEIEDEDTVFFAYKYDRKAGQALRIWVDQYKWDTDYVNPETGSRVGGDNIGGLADRSEKNIREYFTDIKDRDPLRKRALNRYIRKAETYTVKGMTEKGDLYEWQTWFFKNSKVQKTFKIVIIASLGMLDRNPYELEEILATVKTFER